MSLLQCMSYKDYKRALTLSREQYERMARLADLDISFNNTNKPGELLMKQLDKMGVTVQRYTQLYTSLFLKTSITYHKPQTKVAILIANDKYVHLSKLATPSMDCDSLALKLQNLGFIVLEIKNTTSNALKDILRRVCDFIPEDSYCFIFYAGHGCQLCNTMCMLGIDCPTENMEAKHCVTENFVYREMSRCKLDLLITVLDMCRIHLDRDTNQEIYASLSTLVEDYSIHKNFLVSYSTQSSAAAYEVLQIECSTTIDADVTYELKTGDLEKIVPGASQYVNALCTRIEEDLDVSSMLDKVHADVEATSKKQRPIKLQCGMGKRSLYDPTIGDTSSLLQSLQEVLKGYVDYCTVF